jgi:hypothetical protein
MMKKPETFQSTDDSALAAAIVALHHQMRQTDPAVWRLENGKPRCSYFFDAGQPAPLSIDEIKLAWESGGAAFEKAETFLLSFVPEDQREEASKMLHAAAVDAMAVYKLKYKGEVIPLMNRSKKEIGLHVETRGNKTAYFGRGLSEEAIAKLKREGNFS